MAKLQWPDQWHRIHPQQFQGWNEMLLSRGTQTTGPMGTLWSSAKAVQGPVLGRSKLRHQDILGREVIISLSSTLGQLLLEASFEPSSTRKTLTKCFESRGGLVRWLVAGEGDMQGEAGVIQPIDQAKKDMPASVFPHRCLHAEGLQRIAEKFQNDCFVPSTNINIA